MKTLTCSKNVIQYNEVNGLYAGPARSMKEIQTESKQKGEEFT
jgi:hypothetical protein